MTSPSHSRQQRLLLPMLSIGSICLQVFNVLVVIVLALTTYRLATKSSPTLVQTGTGQPLRVIPMGSNQRTNETLKTFTATALYQLFNWAGTVKDSAGDNIPDPGVDVETPTGTSKVTTPAMVGSMALAEEFRLSMLTKIAELTPRGVFNGQQKVVLVIDQMSEPEPLDAGSWEITVIAHLNIFNSSNALQKTLPFHRVVTLQATTAPLVPAGDTPLEQAVYSMRQAGLEITSIHELTTLSLTE